MGYLATGEIFENMLLLKGFMPGFGKGGPRIFFVRFGNLPCALLGGFEGMHSRENFLKWCNLVRFGVYFDPI